MAPTLDGRHEPSASNFNELNLSSKTGGLLKNSALVALLPQAPCTITSLFEHQVQQNPLLPAVEFEDQTPVNFSELKLLSDRIAVALQVQPTTIVPVCIEPSVELIASIFGILSAGAAYVILDPTGSVQRNKFIIDDVKASVVITSEKFYKLYPHSVLVDDLLRDSDSDSDRSESSYSSDSSKRSADGIQQKNINAPSGAHRSISLSSPAYVIYTSGTTGNPKGVVISHSAATHGISRFSLNKKSRWLLFFNPIFSAAQRTILATLCKGGCLCLTSKERLMFSVTDVIRKMQVDALGVTPSMLATISPEKIPLSLKQITTVGEPVSSSVVHKWADLVDFRVSYGLSECAQLNFSRRLAKGDKPSIVGKPTDSTTAHIFVPGTNDLAIPGEPGELCLTGPQLSDGYLERPDETSKAFVLNPLGSGRMFRTGDHAVQHPNGNFEILGRLDFQVKLNGQRVEPEEVASVLKRHSEVDAVTVIATALGGSDSNSLIAAIVPKSKNDWNQLVSDLRELAENLLPAFMNPSHWLRLDSLPTTPTGKVDIRKIQAKAQSTPPREMSSMLSTNEDFQPVTDFVERKIAATWATILSLDRKSISRNHSFTKLGGNSMQAIQMVNKLRSEGIDLGIEALFENQDLASLRSTAIIQDMLKNESQKALIPFSLIPDEKFAASLKQEEGVLDAYPATAMQESLVALTLNGNKDYLYQRVWEVSNLDLIRLRLAFEIAFLRSDILRTTLDWTESGLFQFVRNDFQLEWKILNLSIDEYKKEDLEAGIKLGRPFFRICLLEEKYLVVSMHHSLFDFLSANFLYEDVSALYSGLRTEPRSPFKKFLQYVLKGNPESKNFWASYLEGMSPTTINHAPTSQKISATRVTPNEAEAIAARLNVTASTVYNMAWALVVSKHLDTLDVTFANTISGRDVFVDGIDRLDGPTLTVVPRRFKFDPLSTLEESLSKAHRESAQVLKHSQYGLRNALKAASQTSTSALFDTLVNILPPISTRASTSDSVFRRHGEKPIWQTEYTTVEIQKTGDDTSYTLSTDMEDIRAEFILDQVIETISKIGREPKSTIKALSIITNREIEKLNPPKLTADRDSLPQLLHGGFEAHARSHPWRVALQWQNEELISYRMLDERANRLARHLQIKGLKHGDFACLLLEKSPNMITAILAVLKAGAAYVPLSPENPVERNKFIIEETEAKLLISETVVEQALELSKLHITGVFLDDLDHSKLDPSPLHAHISGSDTCYVLYTSGSTGMPKGCVIKHSNAAAAIESMVEVEGRRKSANTWRALQFSNYTFDVSVLDIFNTLNTGGTLCMAPTERLLSDLCGAIEEMGVNHAFLTPTVARLIGPGEAPHLGSVIVGGEPMTEDVLKLMAGRRVINGYGPTEASILVTMCDNMLPGDNAKNIGKPLQTVEAFIVDKEGSDLVPYGAIGELCVSGPQISAGYLKREDQTKEVFCETLLGSFGRMYRTGDLARWLPDGNIECLGRKDNQVKVNGHRIELGEIENAILRTQSISQCVTIVSKVGTKPQLVSFVVFKGPTRAEKGIQTPAAFESEIIKLRGDLKTLAVYMIPKVVIPLGVMPKLPSGKSDRKLLASWVKEMSTEILTSYILDSFGVSHAAVTPIETASQKLLAKAFAKILSIDQSQIGQETNFLSVGGDSISAIQLTGFVRKQGKVLSVGNILKFPTLKDMAATLKDVKSQEGVQRRFEAPDLSQYLKSAGLALDQIEFIYPCPPGQSEFLTQGKREEQMWVLMTTRPFTGSEDLWIEVVEQLTLTNEILRTTFVEFGHQWVGVVLQSNKIKFDRIELASPDAKAEALQSIWESRFEFGKPFIKYALLSYPDGKRELTVKLDHGLYDGTLLRVFASHMKALQHNLALEFTPFKDFASSLWQSDKAEALKFWSEQENRPTGFQFPPIPTGVIPTATKAIFKPFDVKLEAFASACGVTVSIIFQAAFQLWISKSANSSDIGLDYLYTGRNIEMPDPEGINGTCANFVPLRSKIRNNLVTIKDYLNETQDFFWAATDNGNVTLTEIYRATGLERRTKENRALFLFQPFEPAPQQANGVKRQVEEDMRWVYMAGSEVRMDQPYGLVCEVAKTLNGHRIKFLIDERVFSAEEAKKGVEEVCEILTKMVSGDGSVNVGTFLGY